MNLHAAENSFWYWLDQAEIWVISPRVDGTSYSGWYWWTLRSCLRSLVGWVSYLWSWLQCWFSESNAACSWLIVRVLWVSTWPSCWRIKSSSHRKDEHVLCSLSSSNLVLACCSTSLSRSPFNSYNSIHRANYSAGHVDLNGVKFALTLFCE
jgi:hypothetical protein